jgi:hypothetical protein
LQRYLPKFQGNGWNTFGQALKAAANLGGSILGDATTGVVDREFMDLIDQQMEMQYEMQQVSMLSNIERSEHEAKMAPIRNIRLS